MTLRGKRKALNNNPEAQIAAIAEAFGGKVPVKPLHRRYPQAAWQEGNTFHIAKLTRGKLHHLTSKGKPQTGILFRDALSACGYLAHTYYRKVSLSDLQAATAGLARAIAEGKKLGRPNGSQDKKKRKRTGYLLRYTK